MVFFNILYCHMIQNSKGAKECEWVVSLALLPHRHSCSHPKDNYVTQFFWSCQNSHRHLQANIYRDFLFFFNQILAHNM